ncbi:MAG TPA: hypothetical protein VGI85_08475 [Chthoniobacterales bacterium]|jgi:hypothetical protein
MSNGTHAGELTIEDKADGTLHAHYRFRDNVNRPELDETYRLAPDGTYAEYHVKGQSVYGLRVDEQFRRTADRAAWNSSSDD